MTIVNIETDKEAAEFARRASENFRDNPKYYTFSDGDPECGQLFAIRWNSFAVLVVRLHEDTPVRVYPIHQFNIKDFPND